MMRFFNTKDKIIKLEISSALASPDGKQIGAFQAEHFHARRWHGFLLLALAELALLIYTRETDDE